MVPKKSGSDPTMNDVARLAGVSQGCVSVVLNDAPGARIPQATRQRVKQAAEELGYRLPEPRRRTRKVSGAATTAASVAFVVPEISVSPHGVNHINGARDAAWANEHLVQTYVTRSSQGLEDATIARVLRDREVVGAIYATPFAKEVEVPAALHDFPTVLLNCHTPEPGFHTVLPDDRSGGLAATQYLVIYGHERIAMINGERWMDASRHRLRGYRDALEQGGIKYDSTLVKYTDWSVASGYRWTHELMQQPDPPTAFYCASDYMAMGCIDALSELGLRVPEDVSVVGHNDLDIDSHLRPPLSSSRQPSYEMGKRAVEILLDQVSQKKPNEYSLTKIESKLVVRSSVSRARTSAAAVVD